VGVEMRILERAVPLQLEDSLFFGSLPVYNEANILVKIYEFLRLRYLRYSHTVE
jgi:hypothetical protein